MTHSTSPSTTYGFGVCLRCRELYIWRLIVEDVRLISATELRRQPSIIASHKRLVSIHLNGMLTSFCLNTMIPRLLLRSGQLLRGSRCDLAFSNTTQQHSHPIRHQVKEPDRDHIQLCDLLRKAVVNICAFFQEVAYRRKAHC